MLPVHQKIFVYGFVTSHHSEVSYDPLSFEFSMQMRAKNSDEEDWEYLNPDEPF